MTAHTNAVAAAAREKKLGRGLLINNPLNVKWNARNKWQGQAVGNRDGALEAFVSPQAGVRAAWKIMFKYRDRGLDTIQEIIGDRNGWAPPPKYAPEDKNETERYIEFVEKRMGIPRQVPIEIDDADTALRMIRAMGRFEQGVELPYSDAVILEGLRSAGVVNAPVPVLGKTLEGVGAKISAGGVGGVSTIEVGYDLIDQIEPFKATLIELAPMITAAKYILLAITVAGILISAWGFLRRRRTGVAA